MALRLAAPIVPDYWHLAQHMRSDEVAQFLALTGHTEYLPDDAARSMAASSGDQWALIDADNKAVMVGGFDYVRPGVFSGWMVSTDAAWATHWRSFTRHGRALMARLFDSGRAHRIEVFALVNRRATHAWYKRGLQMKWEGEHEAFYADGQDAVCHARTLRMHEEAR